MNVAALLNDPVPTTHADDTSDADDEEDEEEEEEQVKPWPWEVKRWYEVPQPCDECAKTADTMKEDDLRCTELDDVPFAAVVASPVEDARQSPPPKRLRSCLKDDDDDSCERPKRRVRFDV